MSEVETPVTVTLDNRVRLLAAVLSLTAWPALEQAQAPHAVHTQSKLSRLALEALPSPVAAVATINAALAAGCPLADLFTAVLCTTWPTFTPQESLPSTLHNSGLLPQLAQCAAQAKLEQTLWVEQAAVWDEAEHDLQIIFRDNPLPAFLAHLIGRPLAKPITIVPTLVYPMLSSVVAETNSHITLIIPPPKAWGESPPWPYRDGHDVVLAETCRELLRHLLAPHMGHIPARQLELLQHAAATLFLESALTDGESMSYLVRTKRQYSLPELPLFVEKLRTAMEHGSPDLAALV